MASQKVKLAVLGSGRWGMNHVRTAFAAFGDSLAAVGDINEGAKEKIAEISKSIKFTPSSQEIIDDSSIQAVIIATPAETHYRIVKACLEAGKDVLVEKPITLFSQEARELEKIAREKKRILMVGHILLYHPAIRKIKQLLDQGELGKLQYLYSNRLNLGAVRKEENILWSFAPHDISVLQYLVGEDPESVDASGAVFIQPGIHDVTHTTLQYPRNVYAHIHVSWLHPFKEQRLVVIGDKSMIVFEDSRKDNKLMLYPKGIDMVLGVPQKREQDAVVVEYENVEPLRAEQEHFVQCVISRTQPLTDGMNGIKVLEILEKAQAKLEHRPVPPPPKKEEPAKAYYVHPQAVVDDGVDVGEGTKIWHFSHVQKGAKIGKKCVLGQNVNVANDVTIGNFVKIQNNVSVYEGVTLEDYVFCGPSMVFTNILDPRCKYPQVGKEFYINTLIREGASLGANSTIVCGHTVGRFAFVGAGAVVTKNIPDFALVVGNPAKVIGWVSEAGKRLTFDAEGFAYCAKSKKWYKMENGIVREAPERPAKD